MSAAGEQTMMERVLPTLGAFSARVNGWRPALKPFYFHLTGVALVCGLGAVVAVATIFAPLPANLTQDRWGLVQWQPYRAGPLRDEMINMNLWGETVGAKVEAAAPVKVVPKWRFVGTVTTGASRVAVVEVDASTTKRFGVGDVLPNGARIESVGPGEIVVAEEGANRTIKLFDVTAPNVQNPAADGKPPAK